MAARIALQTAVAGAVAGCSTFAAPHYAGPRSAHFDGRRFLNEVPTPHKGVVDFLRWRLSREPGTWSDFHDGPIGPPPPPRVATGDLRVTFVGHATVLVQVDGLNLLTDPIWSERCSPVSWAGPKRLRPPGIRFEDLPRIDAVLISHNHYDHLDLPTLRRLVQRDRPRILAGLGNRALFEQEGIGGATDLDWWQATTLAGASDPSGTASGVTVTAVPAQHFSGRGLSDRDATLWVGFVVQGPSGVTYFAGDTGFGPHFQQIRDRFGPPRLALLPIGAYRPRWFMAHVHMDPADAVQASLVLGAGTSLGVHFGTFALADEGEWEPQAALTEALASLPPPGPRFWVLPHGEGRQVPHALGAEASP